MKTKTTLAEFKSLNSVRKKRILRKNAWCWVFMLPTLILYILFQGYPIITSAWYSLLDWSGMTMNATYVGLGNFKELLADPLFYNSVANSFKYMALACFVSGYCLHIDQYYPERGYSVPYHVFRSCGNDCFYRRNYYDFYFRRYGSCKPAIVTSGN